MKLNSALLLAAALSMIGITPPSALAQGPSGWYFEAFSGGYTSGLDALNESAPWGLRVGVKPPDGMLGLDFEYGRLDGNIRGIETDEGPVDVRYDASVFDASLAVWLADGRRLQFMLFGGIGWTFADATATRPIDDEISIVLGGADADTFTTNIGLAARVFIGDTVFLRGDVRGRWYEKRERDSTDTEYTLALGFSL